MILIRDVADPLLFLTSANLAPGSIDKHLNWAMTIASAGIADAVSKVFDAIWDGDFRGANAKLVLSDPHGGFGRLAVGAAGEAIDEAVCTIESARERIRFGYFTMTSETRIVQALLTAADRGVDVAGFVDADQGAQFWNAVPQLRSGGVDARYYPGALTGASGRMHHKTIVVDKASACLATANASQSAERSFELAVTIVDAAVANFVDAEIVRLGANASIHPIAPI